MRKLLYVATITLSGLCAQFGGPLAARPPVRQLMLDLQALDASFVCPAALADDNARRQEANAFSRRLAARGLSLAQATKVRRNFLDRHGCGTPTPEVGQTTPTKLALGAAN